MTPFAVALKALNAQLEAARALAGATPSLSRGYGLFRRLQGFQPVAFTHRNLGDGRWTQITLSMTAEGKFGAQVRTMEMLPLGFQVGPRVLGSSQKTENKAR